jgi:hypothetical protein
MRRAELLELARLEVDGSMSKLGSEATSVDTFGRRLPDKRATATR